MFLLTYPKGPPSGRIPHIMPEGHHRLRVMTLHVFLEVQKPLTQERKVSTEAIIARRILGFNFVENLQCSICIPASSAQNFKHWI
jgi:hypothetical protein